MFRSTPFRTRHPPFSELRRRRCAEDADRAAYRQTIALWLFDNTDVIVLSVAKWEIEEHGSRVRDFISGLTDVRAFDEVAALIKLVRERGNRLRKPRSAPLGGGLFELRGEQVRIFYMFRPSHRVAGRDGQEAQ
jgi:Phage derived protein Gp49-like (DUF891)